MWNRLAPGLQQRILFLLAANAAAVGAIGFLLKEGASLRDVLVHSGSNVAPVVLGALGMTGIIFSGAIDLSIASILVVAATVFGIAVAHGLPPWICYGACVATACLLSVWNGCLIRWLRVPAIIVTLAGLPFYRGLALVIADVGVPDFSGNISVQDPAYHGPGREYGGLILLAAVAAALLWESCAKTPRHWLALGSSEEACRLMGLSPGRILQSAFLAGGIFLGLASLMYATRIQAIEPARMALGFELQVIGAVVLGGTNIFGGEGSYAGAILGAFFLYFIAQLLVYAGASPYIQDAITGAVILGVIGLDCALHRRRKWIEELA